MRLGIIGSSGGSALASAVECLRQAGRETDFCIVTDRECGMLQWARRKGIPVSQITYQNAGLFSSEALDFFLKNGVKQVLLFYTRRVSRPLINGLPLFNIHPALLPAFRGLHGVDDALKAGVRIIGATLHYVDEGLDTGPVVAQVSTGLPVTVTSAIAEKISYLQKVYLTLLWYELIHDFGLVVDVNTRSVLYNRQPAHGINASPSLTDFALKGTFNKLQENEKCHVV